ncbi:MAG: uroporphyrinogen decarboxylase family protein [Kiritimatiellae bacterium]|nr:uroporphyrinogen decarboxylase family protein [Kiritimatiellia bacterium]
MTSRQLVLEAINHRATSRIPITFDAEKEVYESLYNHLGLKTKEALFDRLHVDTWMILPGNFMYPAEEMKKEEKTNIWGYKTRVTKYSGGTYDELFFSPLSGKDDIADIKAHKWPSPGTLDFSHFPQEAKQHSDRAVIGVFTWGAYFIASFVRGMEDLMIDFALRKDYADHLIKTISGISSAALRSMLEKYGDGIDIVYMADDYCSQQSPLFSPATFQEFVVPYLKEFTEIVHKHNKKFLLHCCGAVRPLLPMIIDAGVDMLEPIQIRAEGMDPSGLKKDFGKDLCFYGGVDLQNILCKGTPQQVADEVKRLIDILGVNGGYILGPGHTYIQVDALLANIMAMYETAYGYNLR